MDEFAGSYSLLKDSGDVSNPHTAPTNAEGERKSSKSDSGGTGDLAPVPLRPIKHSILKKRSTGERNDSIVESEVAREAKVTFSEPHFGELPIDKLRIKLTLITTEESRTQEAVALTTLNRPKGEAVEDIEEESLSPSTVILTTKPKKHPSLQRYIAKQVHAAC